MRRHYYYKSKPKHSSLMLKHHPLSAQLVNLLLVMVINSISPIIPGLVIILCLHLRRRIHALHILVDRCIVGIHVQVLRCKRGLSRCALSVLLLDAIATVCGKGVVKIISEWMRVAANLEHGLKWIAVEAIGEVVWLEESVSTLICTWCCSSEDIGANVVVVIRLHTKKRLGIGLLLQVLIGAIARRA